MKLLEFKISGLYGYIDKRIKFHHDLSLLVGINGSGKTSVLRLLDWMLRPSLPELCATELAEVSLTLSRDGGEYELRFVKTDTQAKYFVSRKDRESDRFQPLEIGLTFPVKTFGAHPELREPFLQQYSGLTPTPKEFKTWRFLNGLPKPVLLGLERTQARDRRETQARREPHKSSMDEVKNLANASYSVYRSRIIELNNQLKDMILLSAFDAGVFRRDVRRQDGLAPVELPKIQQWRERVVRYISQGPESQTRSSKALLGATRRYFDNLVSLVTKKRKSLHLGLLSWEFQKLQRLIVHLEDFERQSEEAYAGVKGYLGRLNGFFKDSSKEVLFNDSVNQICFRVLNKHDEPIGGLRDVDFLSSGEQQLLILFTFIKFSPGRVFVIDEPELSLHPKWQHHFLDAVRGLMPPGTQLILATHSPSIVGRSTGCCIPLLPYNE